MLGVAIIWKEIFYSPWGSMDGRSVFVRNAELAMYMGPLGSSGSICDVNRFYYGNYSCYF